MRILACMTLSSLLLAACGDDGNMATTQSSKTAEPGDSTNDPSASSTVTPGTDTGTTAASADDTSGEPTTAAPTSEPGTSTGEPDPTTGDATTETVDEGLMGKYGHACESAADCKPFLGETGVCQKEILGVYNLPGGYCTTYCHLPDPQTTSMKPPNDCTMASDCVGLMGFFEAFAYECTDNAQCPREGYECRQMPMISNPDDPKYCLMTEDNMIMP